MIISFLVEGEPMKDNKAKKFLSTHSLYLIIAQDHQVVRFKKVTWFKVGNWRHYFWLLEIYADISTKTKHYTY